MKRVMCGMVMGMVLATFVGFSGNPFPAAAQEKKKDAPAAYLFEVYKDSGGKFRYRFKAGDKSLAIFPTGYGTKEEVVKMIDTIKKEAAKAKVEDNTKDKK